MDDEKVMQKILSGLKSSNIPDAKSLPQSFHANLCRNSEDSTVHWSSGVSLRCHSFQEFKTEFDTADACLLLFDVDHSLQQGEQRLPLAMRARDQMLNRVFFLWS